MERRGSGGARDDRAAERTPRACTGRRYFFAQGNHAALSWFLTITTDAGWANQKANNGDRLGWHQVLEQVGT
jgi:hypothetical protein